MLAKIQASRYPLPAVIAAVSVLLIISYCLFPGQGALTGQDEPASRWAHYLTLDRWKGSSAGSPHIDTTWRSAFGNSGQAAHGPGTCDPHDLPGVMYLADDFETPEGALETLWRPFNDSSGTVLCPTQSYVMSIAGALRDARDADGQYRSSTLLDSLPQAFKNRTIFLFGDSIDRNNIEFACKMLQGKHDSILPDTPLWPQEAVSNDPNVKGWKPNQYSARSFPTFCHIEPLDLMIVNVFHFGLDEEGYFEWKDQYGPPYSVEQRLQEIVVPLIEKLQRPIDVFSFGSGLWDLARFGRIDDSHLSADSTTTLRHLTVDRLAWFSRRYEGALSAVSSALASLPLSANGADGIQQVVRILHIASDDSNDDFQKWWQVPGGGADGNKHTYYFPSWRVSELNAAIRNAVGLTNRATVQRHLTTTSDVRQNSPSGHPWVIDTWGDKLYGLEIYDKGNVHPHFAATTVWLEQMLFRLINGH